MVKTYTLIITAFFMLIIGGCKVHPENPPGKIGTDDTNRPGDDYVFIVLAEQLNLRTEPSLEGPVVTVLKEGDKIHFIDSDRSRLDTGHDWIEVTTADGKKGWVALEFTVREALLTKYEEVIDLVKSGEMEKANGKWDEFGTHADPNARDFFLDPEGRFLVIRDYSTFQETNYTVFENEIIYLRNGVGVIGTGIADGAMLPVFSGSGDYIAYPWRPRTGVSDAFSIVVMDVKSMAKRVIPEEESIAYKTDGYSAGAFAPGSDILLYIGGEVNNELEEAAFYPDLYAYDARTGTMGKVMETDKNSITELDRYPYRCAKLKEVAPSSIPPSIDMDAVKASKLYRTLASGELVRIGRGEM
jgi:hypothetical protein